MSERKPSYQLIEKWLNDKKDRRIVEAGLNTLRDVEVPYDILEKWMNSENHVFRVAAMRACVNWKAPLSFLEKGLNDADIRVRLNATTLYRTRELPEETRREMMKSENDCERMAAMASLWTVRDIPMDLVDQARKDPFWGVRAEAMRACWKHAVPKEWIQEGLQDTAIDINRMAAKVALTHPDANDIIRTALEDPAYSNSGGLYLLAMGCADLATPFDVNVAENWLLHGTFLHKLAALNAYKQIELPMGEIMRMLSSDNPDIRMAAVNSCMMRDDAEEALIQGVRDHDTNVVAGTMDILRAKRMELPLIRTVEPPDIVYKKCLGGVLVTAKIPRDAQIRNWIGSEQYRSDKAEILSVSDENGFAIAAFDKRTLYYPGKYVEIPNFDYRFRDNAPGFHFFNNREQAERYLF